MLPLLLPWYVKKMCNNFQFTIDNHSHYHLKKNLVIFHYIKAQIRETHNFGYQRQYTFFSMQNLRIQTNTDRQTDRQISKRRELERQTDRQSDRK